MSIRSPVKQTLAVLILASAMIVSACPSESQLDKAARASNSLAGATSATVDVVRVLYTERIIDDAAKDSLADALKVIAASGASFNALVRQYDQLYKNGHLPDDAWNALRLNFGAVVAPYLRMLESLNRLSTTASVRIRATLAVLSHSILTIENVLNYEAR